MSLTPEDFKAERRKGDRRTGFDRRHSANKFSAERQEYNGRWFDSKLEASYAMELDWRLKAKDIAGWEHHRESYDLSVNGHKICGYRPDFWITHNNGTLEVVEVKGFPTRDWLLTWKLFNALYGDQFKITLEQRRR